MGRSFGFSYKSVEKVEETSPDVLKVLESLSVGDRIVVEEVTTPQQKGALRSPSTYGMSEIRFDLGKVFVVRNTNTEPGLEEQKGIRVLSMWDDDDDDDDDTKKTEKICTWVLTTDGGIRECEALGLENIISKITRIT